MTEPEARVRDPLGKRALVAMIAGGISVLTLLLLGVDFATAFELGDSVGPLVVLMCAATLVATVAGIAGLRKRGERRFAAAGLLLALPALVIVGATALFVILVLTGVIEFGLS